MRRSTRLVAGAAGLLLLAAAGPAAADTALTSNSVTSVDAFGGFQVWDVPNRAGDSWKLYRSSRSVRALPVKRSAQPFEADLGARLGGGVVAVYTRCRAKRRCAIYSFDFVRKRERREPNTHRKGCTEGHASSWRGAVAFVRSGSARCRPGLYLRGSGRRARARRIAKIQATATDMRGQLILWQDKTRIGKLGFGGKQTVLSGAGGQGPRGVALVGLDAGTIYFLEIRDQPATPAAEDTRSLLIRMSNRGQSREEAELAGQRAFPGSAAVDGRRFFYRLGGRSGRLFESDPFPIPRV